MHYEQDKIYRSTNIRTRFFKVFTVHDEKVTLRPLQHREITSTREFLGETFIETRCIPYFNVYDYSEITDEHYGPLETEEGIPWVNEAYGNYFASYSLEPYEGDVVVLARDYDPLHLGFNAPLDNNIIITQDRLNDLGWLKKFCC